MSNSNVSEAQIKANQANAQKSTGPKTPQGKIEAKFNARRHGLTGQFYCMSEGDEKAFQAFEEKMLTNMKPSGAYESQLAISIVQDHWRLNRSKGVEHNIIGLGHERFAETTHGASPSVQSAVTMTRTWMTDDQYFTNIALYETRIHRMIVSNEKRLKAMQEERLAAEKVARREAELLIRLALFKGESFESVIPANGPEAENVHNGRPYPHPCPKPGTIQVNGSDNGRPYRHESSKLGTIEVNGTDTGRPYRRESSKPGTIQVNGFEFSVPEIILHLNRKQQLSEAEHMEKNDWDPTKPYPKRA